MKGALRAFTLRQFISLLTSFCSVSSRDNVLERVLTVAIDVPAGVKAETCTAGCQTAGFDIAGLEGMNLELLFND